MSDPLLRNPARRDPGSSGPAAGKPVPDGPTAGGPAPRRPDDRRPVVAIVGGGFSGATAAFHLARATAPGALDIVVIEPRAALGHGLAYSTADPAHRINVPAARMTMISAEPGHLTDWLETAGVALSPGTARPNGDLFIQRGLIGRYVAAHLAPLQAEGRIRHLRVAAAGVAQLGGRHRIALSDGTRLDADLLVIATSHPLPGLPAALRAVAASPRLIADPSDAAAVAAVGPDERVLIVGTGLTSADVIASLDAAGHRGPIIALSRRGQRSRGHAAQAQETAADFAAVPAPTARALLCRIRIAVAADAAQGLSWHAVFDRLRAQGPAIWAALDLTERARLLRHLRLWWDVHRFRIAPQVAELLDARAARGGLEVFAGRIVAATEAEGALRVSWRPRRGGARRSAVFDRVIVTTGPAHGAALDAPWLRDLLAAGEISPDPLGLGIRVAEGCRAVDAAGRISARVLVCGPLARGHVGELMGVPEVTLHAELVARTLARISATLPA